MDVTVICSPAGGGKTTAMAKKIAHANKDWRIEVYVPTHALAMEWRGIITGVNSRCVVRVIGGRNHQDTQGNELCMRHTAAAQISKSGQSVYSRLCQSSGGMRCNFHEGCKYIDQFANGHVYIYTHAYLPLDRGMLDRRVPDLVVIDESFFSVCLEKIQLNISLLTNAALPLKAMALCSDIANAIYKGTSLYPVIKQPRHRGCGLPSVVKALRLSAPKSEPNQSDQEVSQLLHSVPNFEPLARMLTHLARTFGKKQSLQSIDFDALSGMITVHHRRDITRFKQKLKGLPDPKIFILDATASEPIVKAFFPDAKFIYFRTERKANVIQCRSTAASTRSINPGVHTNPKSLSEATQKLDEVQLLINELSRDGQKLLVIGPSKITGNPGKGLPAQVHVPPHCALGHFSAIRGVDAWKSFDSVLVLGRNEPPVSSVEDLARALYFDHLEPLQLPGQWTTAPRGYRLRSHREGVDVAVHVDSRVQAILEQVRESEALQTIDRLRLIYCDEPKLVVLLSNIPLDIDVDMLMTWDEMIYGSRLEQAWLSSGDVMPLSPSWLAENFQELWPSTAAAKKDVQRGAKRGHITNRLSIRKMSPFTFEYRAEGQRRASYCLSQTDNVLAVSEALSVLLGYPVRVSRLQTAQLL